MKIDIDAVRAGNIPSHDDGTERAKYRSRKNRKARRRQFAQNNLINPKVRPMNPRRIDGIVRRIPAILRKKYAYELVGTMTQLGLLLMQEGAMKEPNYGRPIDREETMMRAINRAISSGAVSVEYLDGERLRISVERESQDNTVRQLQDPQLFKYCPVTHLDELRHHAA